LFWTGLKLSLSPEATTEDSLRGKKTDGEHICDTMVEPGR